MVIKDFKDIKDIKVIRKKIKTKVLWTIRIIRNLRMTTVLC